MSKYKLSVCIPAYNAAEWIHETIQSVLDQRTADVEIVICENHSKDDTRARLRELEKKWPNQFRVVSPPKHLAMADNWNYAVSCAHGEYVLMLSADDMLSPGVCATAIKTLDTEPGVDVVTFEHDRVVHDGDHVRIEERKLARWMTDKQGISTALVLSKNPFSINFSIVRRNSFVGEDGRLGNLFRRSLLTTDYDFWLRVAINSQQVRYHAAPKGLYRVHGSNLSTGRERMLIHTFLTVVRFRETLQDSENIAYRILLVRLWLRTLLEGKRLGRKGRRVRALLPHYIFK